MKKIASLPLPAYLKKYIEKEFQRHFNAQGCLVLKKRMATCVVNDYKTAHSYFKKHQQAYPSIQVESHAFKPDYLYAFVVYCRHRFVESMCEYVAAREGLQPFTVSIREFLAAYDIYEREYSFETAYKNWQRSDKYLTLKSKKHEPDFKALRG